MRALVHTGVLAGVVATTLAGALPLAAQGRGKVAEIPEVFRRVSASVVVVRTLEQGAPNAAVPGGALSLPGLGSGVIISAEGRVLTASHVVQSADRIGVELPDGRLVAAHVVASSPPSDVALLQLDQVPEPLTPATLGNSDDVNVGDEILVVGAAYGLGRALTVGHISARVSPPQPGGTLSALEMFQTDAAMNVGNSGGPMFNRRGEVVGIVSSIVSQSGGFEGVGFAITSNVARRLLLEQRGFWFGADGYVVHGDLARVFNVPQSAGVLVQRVARGSPAARIGLRAGRHEVEIAGEALIVGGDIILQAAGVPVVSRAGALDQIHGAISRLAPGEAYTITVLRAGRIVELKGTIPAS